MNKTIEKYSLLILVFIFIWFLICTLIIGFVGASSNDLVVTKRPGQPLDSHIVEEYDRPTWLPDCDISYKVTDRTDGTQWWLLKMKDGSYVSSKDI